MVGPNNFKWETADIMIWRKKVRIRNMLKKILLAFCKVFSMSY